MPDARTRLMRLRDADASLAQERLRPPAARRIRRRMDRELAGPVLHGRRWIPMATFLAGAALVLLVFAFGSTPRTVEQEHPEVEALETAASPHGSGCRWNDRAGLRMEGACEVKLHSPPVAVHTIAGTRLRIDRRRAVLEQGGALFDVSPVPGARFEVELQAGTIVVVGTRFRVVVEESGGHIELYEGVIDFIPTAGDRVRLRAGQRYDFTMGAPDILAAHPNVTEEPEVSDESEVPEKSEVPEVSEVSETGRAKAAPRRSVAAPPEHRPALRSASDLVDEVAALRARGEYEAAARRLEAALATPGWDARAAEVLSFELGTISTRHLSDPRRACRHWNAHLERFENTRYREAIERHLARLDCVVSEP
jgi:hypothetical protein